MAEPLACEASDRIASFVSAISSLVPVGKCNPERPVPLLTSIETTLVETDATII
jgi:poly(3-hydroxybutyrate) depolymerase